MTDDFETEEDVEESPRPALHVEVLQPLPRDRSIDKRKNHNSQGKAIRKKQIGLTVREHWLDSFLQLQGPKGLELKKDLWSWATDPEHPENLAVFYKIVAFKLIPNEVTGAGGGPLVISIPAL